MSEVEPNEHDEFGTGAFLLALAFGILCRTYLAHALRLPYTVILLLLGLWIGFLHVSYQGNNSWMQNLGYSLEYWINMSPEAYLYTFLPILIFESAYSTNVHIFEKEVPKILVLAGLGVIVASILTAVVAKYVFPYDWSWNMAMMFGAMMSATDPVAVVALLKELGVSERLSVLIEGESLLNDGTAYVIFYVFLLGVTGEKDPTPANVVETGARLALGGPCVGAVLGYIGSFLVGFILNDALCEITITFAVCYSAFIISEGTDVHVSSILAVVAAGIVFSYKGRGRVSSSVVESLHSFWEMAGYIANTVIFFISGVFVAQAINSGYVGGKEWGYLFVLYIFLLLIRGVVVLIFSPALVSGSYGMNWKQLCVLSYGGLRGAVGLILALVVVEEVEHAESELHRHLETEHGSSTTEETLAVEAERILFYMAGIAALTLVINGSTTGMLLHLLDLDSSSQAETEVFVRTCSAIEAKMEIIVQKLKGNELCADADYETVWRYIPLMTAKAYWHRIRAGHIELSEKEEDDMRHIQPPTWKRIAHWTRRNFFGHAEGLKYMNIPPRLRSSWKQYHMTFHMEHSMEALTQIIQANRNHARYGNLGMGLIHHERLTFQDEFLLEGSIDVKSRKKESLRPQNEFGRTMVKDRIDLLGTSAVFTPEQINAADEVKEASLEDEDVIILGKGPRKKSLNLFGRPRKESGRDLKEQALNELQKGSTRDLDHNLMDEDTTGTGGNRVQDRIASDLQGTTLTSEDLQNLSADEKNALLSNKTRSARRLKDELEKVQEDIEKLKGERNFSISLKERRDSVLYTQLTLLTLENRKQLKRFLLKEPKVSALEQDTLKESRSRVLKMYHSQFDDLFAQGWVSAPVLQSLLDAVETELDRSDQKLGLWTNLHQPFTFIRTNIPSFQKMQNVFGLSFMVNRLLGYKFEVLFGLATAFLKASEEVMEDIAGIPHANQLKDEIQDQYEIAKKSLHDQAEVFPEIARSATTKSAARYLLVKQHELVEDFFHVGQITEKEMEVFHKAIDSSRVKLDYHPILETIKSRSELIGYLPFLDDTDPSYKEHFLSNDKFVTEEFHLANETLIEPGKTTASRGNKGTRATIRVSEKETIDQRRSLVDRIKDTRFRGPLPEKPAFYVLVRGSIRQTIPETGQTRILHPGAIFGLDEQLYHIPYKATYTTASFCHCFCFDSQAILAEAEKDVNLKKRLWLTLAIACARYLVEFKRLNMSEIYEILKEAKFHAIPEALAVTDIEENQGPPLPELEHVHSSFKPKFMVAKGSHLLLLKGYLHKSTDPAEIPEKHISYIKDVYGEVHIDAGSILFELKPSLVEKFKRMEESGDQSAHRNTNVLKDYHAVNHHTVRKKGKLVGRTKELMNAYKVQRAQMGSSSDFKEDEVGFPQDVQPFV